MLWFIWSVWFVWFILSVWFILFDSVIEPNEPKKPEKPNEQERREQEGGLAPLAAEPVPVLLRAEADAAGGDWSGPFLLLRRFVM